MSQKYDGSNVTTDSDHLNDKNITFTHARGDPGGRVTPRSHGVHRRWGGAAGGAWGPTRGPIEAFLVPAPPDPACSSPVARRPPPASTPDGSSSLGGGTCGHNERREIRWKKSGGRPPRAAGSEGGRCVCVAACVAACVRAGEAAAGVVPAAQLKDAARRRRSRDKIDG